MTPAWLDPILTRLPELWLRIGEHLVLTGVSTAAAVAAGIPLGVAAVRIGRLRGPVLAAVGILQTVPSLAMLAILLALTGRIGVVPAIIALVLYALLPIVRNAVSGLDSIPASINEAARGVGMTGRQQLLLVQLPLASPIILAGVRTAAVTGVGIATLSAFIGAGGLGQFINRGLALSDTSLILLGAIPAAILALVVDATLATAQWSLDPTADPARRRLRRPALIVPIAPFILGIAIVASNRSAVAPSGADADPGGRVGQPIRVATKNFTEQLILGELIAQLIDHHTALPVERRFNLGGTLICHRALVAGQIDIYPEYTGTALTAILDLPVPEKTADIQPTVSRLYRDRFHLTWLGAFGFNNTYALAVRRADAQAHHWRRISDLAPHASTLTAGFTAEFAARPDGYPGLSAAYGLRFARVVDFDPTLMYEAIANGQADVICAFATDGRIASSGLQPLIDDDAFFPPYLAAPVIRTAVLDRYPQIATALAPLAGRIDDATMQNLNDQVDRLGRTPADAAHQVLLDEGLLGD